MKFESKILLVSQVTIMTKIKMNNFG